MGRPCGIMKLDAQSFLFTDDFTAAKFTLIRSTAAEKAAKTFPLLTPIFQRTVQLWVSTILMKRRIVKRLKAHFSSRFTARLTRKSGAVTKS